MLVYIDDIILLTGNNDAFFIEDLIQMLWKKFAVKNIGKLHYVLGKEIKYFN